MPGRLPIAPAGLDREYVLGLRMWERLGDIVLAGAEACLLERRLAAWELERRAKVWAQERPLARRL